MNLEFNKNEDQLKQLCFQLKSKAEKTMLGGGEKKIEDQHQKGKLTARERIDYLIDKNSPFLESYIFPVDTKDWDLERWREEFIQLYPERKYLESLSSKGRFDIKIH
jgi:hypothetical protein